MLINQGNVVFSAPHLDLHQDLSSQSLFLSLCCLRPIDTSASLRRRSRRDTKLDGKRTALPSLFLFCLFVTLGLEWTYLGGPEGLSCDKRFFHSRKNPYLVPSCLPCKKSCRTLSFSSERYGRKREGRSNEQLSGTAKWPFFMVGLL